MKPLRRLVQVFAPIDKGMTNDLVEFRLIIIAKGQIKGEVYENMCRKQETIGKHVFHTNLIKKIIIFLTWILRTPITHVGKSMIC